MLRRALASLCGFSHTPATILVHTRFHARLQAHVRCNRDHWAALILYPTAMTFRVIPGEGLLIESKRKPIQVLVAQQSLYVY